MKIRHVLAHVLAGVVLAVGLVGCATVGAVVSGSVANPITPARALAFHASFYAGVVVAAGHYADLERCPAPTPCSEQAVVDKLRQYVNGAEGTLVRLDDWAQGNSRLDGPALFALAKGLVVTAEQYATGVAYLGFARTTETR